MQQLIISTLLKYNEIFDALSQVFQLHNYNCNDQKLMLMKHMEQNAKQSCIYVTFNSNTDFLGINERFLKMEKTVNVNIENMFQFNQSNIDTILETLEQVVATKIEEVENKFAKQINQLSEVEKTFMDYAEETYQSIAAAKQQNKYSNLEIEKLNQEIEFIQQKYALKQTVDQNLVEVRDCISNISQSISYLRNDVQFQFKKITEMKSQMQLDQTNVTEQLCIITKEIEQIQECFNQIGNINKRVENQRKDFEMLSNKFKSIAQLFQELEVNNSKLVKFEIHSTIRKFDEDMLKLSVVQQRLLDQVQKMTDQQQAKEAADLEFRDNFEKITEQYNLENRSISKQVSKCCKMIEQFKVTVSQSSQLSEDLPLQLRGVNSQLQYQWKYFNQCLNLAKESLDIIQDFCETLQLPSTNQEKDLTNLILLLDRRQSELKRNLNKERQTLIKLQTPRNSQQFETPGRIHSQQPRRCIYSKNGSQTISVDSKRETIVIQ